MDFPTIWAPLTISISQTVKVIGGGLSVSFGIDVKLRNPRDERPKEYNSPLRIWSLRLYAWIFRSRHIGRQRCSIPTFAPHSGAGGGGGRRGGRTRFFPLNVRILYSIRAPSVIRILYSIRAASYLYSLLSLLEIRWLIRVPLAFTMQWYAACWCCKSNNF